MADETDDTKNTGEGSKWAAYLDDNGNTYYYNSETNESSWEKPDQEFILPVEEEEQAEAAAANAATDYGEGGENFLSNSGNNKEEEGGGGRTPYHISSPLEVADADAADVESSEVEKKDRQDDAKVIDRTLAFRLSVAFIFAEKFQCSTDKPWTGKGGIAPQIRKMLQMPQIKTKYIIDVMERVVQAKADGKRYQGKHFEKETRGRKPKIELDSESAR